MDVSRLVEKCEEKLKVGKNPYKFLKLALCSFTGNSEYYKNIIKDNKLEMAEIDRFIEICDIKMERTKILTNDASTVFGIIITIVSAIIFSSKIIDKITGYIIPLILLTISTGALIFIVLRGHYRIHINAWTAFKEAAILSEKYSPKGEIKKC